MESAMLCVLFVMATAVASVGSLEAGLKVKYARDENPEAGTKYFFDVPLNITAAKAAGLSEIQCLAAGYHPELVMYCPSDKILCPLYDDNGFIAGLQISLDINSFTNNFLGWENRGFQTWNTVVDGENVTMRFTRQYFVSEEYMAMNKEKRRASYNSSRILQENAVWVTSIDGKLLRVSSHEEDIIDEDVFKNQTCVSWMGLHYYYNLTTTSPCDTEHIYPWFPLFFEGELVGTGFLTIGNMPIAQDKDCFERSASDTIKIVIPNGPQCVYDLSDNFGVLTMHIFYTSTPWLITC